MIETKLPKAADAIATFARMLPNIETELKAGQR